MHTFGGDFHYRDAAYNFENLDRLIGFINNNE